MRLPWRRQPGAGDGAGVGADGEAGAEHEVPRDVVDALGLRRGERILAAAVDGSRRWWAATHDALMMPVRPNPTDAQPSTTAEYRRVPWEDVDKAEWDRDTARFSLVLVGSGTPIHVRFTDADPLLTVLRERVTTSVVAVRTLPLDDAAIVERVGKALPGDAIVTIRRRSADRTLFTQVAFSQVLDGSSPDVRAAAEAAAALARSELGV